VLVAFGAGTFIYITLADLLPELTAAPPLRDKGAHTAAFAAGLVLLGALALIA